MHRFSTLLASALVAGAFGLTSTPALSSPQVQRVEAPAHPADGESLALMDQLNRHEIAMATLALTRPLSQPTQALAGMLQREHTQNAQRLSALGVKPVQTPAVTALADKLGRQEQALKSLPPEAFESAYIDTMSSDHRDALAMIDARAPVARAGQVRAYLMQTRQALDAHYSAARKLDNGAVGQ